MFTLEELNFINATVNDPQIRYPAVAARVLASVQAKLLDSIASEEVKAARANAATKLREVAPMKSGGTD